MTLCPGCNHGVLEPLTPGLRAFLKITDATIRATCTAGCGTVAREFFSIRRPPIARDAKPGSRGFVMKFRGEML